MSVIFFRADGNPLMGSGHIMRCLSLAAAIRDEGGRCVFVCADDCFDNSIRSRGFECRVLGSDWHDMQAELPLFLPLIKEYAPQMIIVDSYFAADSYLRKLKNKTVTAYFDDLNECHPVDIIINYNIYGREETYSRSGAECLTGVKYAPLREEFAALPKRTADTEIKKIFLSVGGADPDEIMPQLLREMQQCEAIKTAQLCAVVGALSPAGDAVREMAGADGRIVPLINVTEMAKLMCECDLAVTAAGSTMYELCACGTPAVSIAYADNQLPGAHGFSQCGIIPFAGDWRESAHSTAQGVVREIARLAADSGARQQRSLEMQSLIDAGGAKRLARELFKAFK